MRNFRRVTDYTEVEGEETEAVSNERNGMAGSSYLNMAA